MVAKFHNDGHEHDPLPAREAWLLAHLDGESSPEDRVRAEQRLGLDPAARADHEANRRLDALFDASAADEPSAKVWATARADIARRLQAAPRGGSRILCALLGVASAAAVFAAVWLGTQHLRVRPPAAPYVPDILAEALPVAGDDDVAIDDMDPRDAAALVFGRVPRQVSEELRFRASLPVALGDEIDIETMEGDDLAFLVVGLPPVTGPLVMALPGEVKVQRIAAMSGNVPQPFLHEPGGGMPMIMFPTKTVRKD